MSKRTSVELVGEFLARRGLLPAGILPFEWSFLWRAPLTSDFQVKIWGEPHTGPSNLAHSRTVAFSHVVERALHLFLGTLAYERQLGASVLVPACREGFVPLSLPIGAAAQATGIDADPTAVLMAQRLADYFGRSDVTFRCVQTGMPLSASVPRHDYVFVALRDEVVDSPRAFLTDLLAVSNRTVIVLSTLDWSELESDPSRLLLPIADATTRAPWDAGSVLIQRKNAP